MVLVTVETLVETVEVIAVPPRSAARFARCEAFEGNDSLGGGKDSVRLELLVSSSNPVEESSGVSLFHGVLVCSEWGSTRQLAQVGNCFRGPSQALSQAIKLMQDRQSEEAESHSCRGHLTSCHCSDENGGCNKLGMSIYIASF